MLSWQSSASSNISDQGWGFLCFIHVAGGPLRTVFWGRLGSSIQVELAVSPAAHSGGRSSLTRRGVPTVLLLSVFIFRGNKISHAVHLCELGSFTCQRVGVSDKGRPL